MKKSIIINLFNILLVLSIVNAAKPTQVFTGDVGLVIRVPQAEYAKQNELTQLNIHVYNLSNGFPMKNDTTSCLLHIFNRTGHHILNEVMNFNEHESDFFLDIGRGNFSKLGFYSFIIGCNTSTIGGFVSGSIEVTRDGKQPPPHQSTIIGIGIVAFLLLFLSFNLDKEHILYRLLLTFFALYLIFLIPATLISGPASHTTFLKITSWLIKTFWIYISTYFVYVLWLKKRLLQSGIFEYFKKFKK